MTHQPDALAATVKEALDNAIEGGYEELLTWDAERVMNDLLDYCADVEGVDPKVLLPVVRADLERRRHA